MARQTGPLKHSGTIGGINYYIMDGVGYARVAGGGFTKEAIKKSPRMGRIRDNNTEFGNASAVKKMFKDSLRLFYGSQKDVKLHREMTSAFYQIRDFDFTSPRGQRSFAVGIQHPAGKKLFMSMEFAAQPLSSRKFVYDSTSLCYTATIDPTDLAYRNGATHVELRLGVVVMDFDERKARLFASAPLRIAKKDAVTDLSLTPLDTPIGNGLRIAVLFHRYLKLDNGEFYPLMDKAVYGLRVLDC